MPRASWTRSFGHRPGDRPGAEPSATLRVVFLKAPSHDRRRVTTYWQPGNSNDVIHVLHLGDRLDVRRVGDAVAERQSPGWLGEDPERARQKEKAKREE